MKAPITIIAPLLALALFVPNVGRTQGPVSNGHVQGAERSWKTVEELSPEELRNVDLRSETPRDSQVSYLPAEPYPFTAPYTAEEMGYRLMEFTQRPRWSCAFANLWGSITPQGVLLNPGKSITFMNYLGPDGVKAEFVPQAG